MLKLDYPRYSRSGLRGRAFGQAPTDHVKIDVTARPAAIGPGHHELPYETAAPLLIDLQKQLERRPEGRSAAPAAKRKRREEVRARIRRRAAGACDLVLIFG